ncbi:YkgJ family cysteine cluster protein [Ideonella sp. 4Y16]|uniref:YkgJ family cysteine cluster protein n=1 Tax=Ideonella alba TaxID=2824118 RepID=A0A940YD65_9BURK|nr:YkgJ family cysteine cluster protein [Ideonella alba]MBQ0932961.1 YkgJ family cysteine cluster protein [Ideonella alba]MBQ0945793.1 YkgJ family cysteine cluster protein [Ideonella alba]
MSLDCTTCGACCATFRVSFHWSETDACPGGGGVPATLTEPVSPHLVAMRGTTARPVRCVALDGQVGQSVGCRIYPLRASTCRSVEPGDTQCRKARAAHGMADPPKPRQSGSA